MGWEEKLNADFDVLSYLNQFHDEGVTFQINREIRHPVDKDIRDESNFSEDVYRPEFVRLTEPEIDVALAFCERLFHKELKYSTIEDVVKDELLKVQSLIDKTGTKYKPQLFLIRKALKEKIPRSTPEPIAIEFQRTPEVQKLELRKPTRMAVAAFCSAVNLSGLMPQGDLESNSDYCKRVCEQYDLEYAKRVRINYAQAKSKRSLEEVKILILPELPKDEVSSIHQALNQV